MDTKYYIKVFHKSFTGINLLMQGPQNGKYSRE